MDRCRRARVLFQRVWRASPSFWITLQQPIRTSTATAATVTTTTLNATTGTPTATTGTSTGSSRRTFALFLPSNTLPWTRPRLQQVRLVSLQQQLQRRRLPLPGSRILSLTLQNRTITGTSDTAKNYFSSHSYGTNGVFWENHNTKRPKVRMVSSFSNTFSTNHRSPPLNDDDATPNGGEIENHVPTTSSGSSVSSASWIPPNVADTSESEDDAADAPPINTSNGTDPGGGADTTANYYELAIRRALQLSPDEEWDKQVLVVAASLPLRKDAEKNHFDSEEPVESYDTTIDYHLSHRQDKNNTDPTNLTLNLSWNDRQWKIQSTARLLNSPVGSWSVEDWFALEDLFVHFWARQDCMRSVVAQLTLFERCLLEKNRIFQVEPCSSSISSSRGEPNILTSEILETTNGVKDGVISLHSSESLEMHINTWLNLHLLNHIVDSWRFVYAAEPLPLRNCQLAPLDVLDKVLHVFHKQLGCEVSAKTFYFIAEAEMAYPHKDRTPEILDKLLATTIGLYNEGMELCLPKNLFWNMALTAWMKAERGSDSVDAVTRLLQTMDDLQISRSKRTYLTAIRAHAQQCSEKAALDAEGLLQRMYSEYVSGAYKVQPDVYAFAAVVDAWAKSKSPLAGPRAEQIYQQMLELRKQDQLYGYKNEDTTLINCAIMCWGNVGTVEAVAKGEAFWRSTGVIPTSVTFTTLINLYSDLGQVADAERLWQELDITEDENGHVLRRENALYLSMLSMYAKSKIPNRVERASSIIQKINDSGEIAPSNAVYNGYLTVLSSFPNISAKLKAQAFLAEMKKMAKKNPHAMPNVISYSIVINAWAKQGHPERASEVLRTMYEDYVSGNETAKPDIKSFNTILAAYIKCKDDNAPIRAENFFNHMMNVRKDGVLHIQPDVYSYSSILACLSNTKEKRPEAAAKAQEILEHMRNVSRSGDLSVLPNTYCYNSVMDCWARASFPERAEAVYLTMCDDYNNGNDNAKPERVTFNILLKAWAFSKAPRAPERSEEILKQMHELALSGSPNLKPDVRTYTTLVTCYGLCKQPGAPQRAQQIVESMDEMFKLGHISEGPNMHTITALRKAWLYSREANKHEAVAAIDREMMSRFGRVAKA